MSKGCEAFLTSVIATTKQRELELVEIPIVYDFADMFSDEV